MSELIALMVFVIVYTLGATLLFVVLNQEIREIRDELRKLNNPEGK